MSTQADWTNSQKNTKWRAPLLTNRQREKLAAENTKNATNAHTKANDLYKEYTKLDTDLKKIEQLIATTTGLTQANWRIQKTATKTLRDTKYNEYLAKKKLESEFTNKANILLGKKDKDYSVKRQKVTPPTIKPDSGGAVFPYKFNAPMVRGAYFNPTSITAKSIDEDNLTINYASYDDALTAWKNAQPARGALQMDREFTQNQIDAFDPSKARTKLDLQMYGFRFLYNPKEVSMGWSTQGFVDPEFVPQDEAIPISANMTASYVSFSLVINRIEDMNFLDQNGFTSEQAKQFANNTRTPQGDLDPAQRNRIYAANLIANSPYPENVTVEDLKDIYEKGTMYDLEYFFKTVNGPAATFENKFGINTADRAYMRLAILELHLGNSMRYRGRITDLEVNHTIFNNRMVPIFSTVRMSFARINDAYVLPDKKTKK